MVYVGVTLGSGRPVGLTNECTVAPAAASVSVGHFEPRVVGVDDGVTVAPAVCAVCRV